MISDTRDRIDASIDVLIVTLIGRFHGAVFDDRSEPVKPSGALPRGRLDACASAILGRRT